MTARESWDSLQSRWAAGDVLSPEEERRRLAGAGEDGLAARELELFAELSSGLTRLSDAAPNVALTLAGARGVKLRVLGPDSVDAAPERKRTHRRVAVAAGAGLVALAAAAALVLRHEGATPAEGTRAVTAPAVSPAVSARSELVLASGDVRVGGASAVIGQRTLSAGTEVATERGRACLTIDPAVDVCLDEKSAVVLEDLSEVAVRVRVTRGTAVAALAPRKAGHGFSLTGGDVVATAHGTVFALELEPSQRVTRVTVVEGSVAVARGRESARMVGAHSSLGVGSKPEDVAAVGRSDEARLHALLSPRELWQGGNLGVLEVTEARRGERAVIDEHGPFALPLRLFVATGRHRVGLRAEQEPESAVDIDVEAGAARRLSPAEIDETAVSSTTVTTGAAPTAKALLDRARQRLAAGDPRAARALYRELRRAYPGSSEAATVLVTLGKLELELGAPERALAAFDAYVEHGGALVPEALSGRIRALRTLGRRAEERRAIEQYLSRYPKGFEAPALEQRLATLTAG